MAPWIFRVMSSPTICKAPGTLSISADRAGASPKWIWIEHLGEDPPNPSWSWFLMIFPSADGIFFCEVHHFQIWLEDHPSTQHNARVAFWLCPNIGIIPSIFWLSQGILPCFFLLPNFCRGHRGEIPHQVLVIHVMDHGPWTPVQQHSGAAYLMLLRSTLARHVGDVERAGRKKWWGWVKIPRIPHYSTLWKNEHPFTSCFHGDGIFGMISDHLMIRTFG